MKIFSCLLHIRLQLKRLHKKRFFHCLSNAKYGHAEHSFAAEIQNFYTLLGILPVIFFSANFLRINYESYRSSKGVYILNIYVTEVIGSSSQTVLVKNRTFCSFQWLYLYASGAGHSKAGWLNLGLTQISKSNFSTACR